MFTAALALFMFPQQPRHLDQVACARPGWLRRMIDRLLAVDSSLGSQSHSRFILRWCFGRSPPRRVSCLTGVQTVP